MNRLDRWLPLAEYAVVMGLLAATLAYGWGIVPAQNTSSTTVRTADIKWSDPRVRNLWRLAICETGGINSGRPLWTHHNGTYTGALGFAHSTWSYYKQHVRPVPQARYASQATPLQQYAVGLVLIETFGGYSSWPACHRRLGLG